MSKFINIVDSIGGNNAVLDAYLKQTKERLKELIRKDLEPYVEQAAEEAFKEVRGWFYENPGWVYRDFTLSLSINGETRVGKNDYNK